MDRDSFKMFINQVKATSDIVAIRKTSKVRS